MEKERLKQEKKEIIDWMCAKPHPSNFRVWTDYADKISKEWTAKSKRLDEINTFLSNNK